MVLPAAFNHDHRYRRTGIITMRARALDNQVYFAANSPARDMNGPYQAYGNSCIVDPWGGFIAHGDEKECIVYGDIDTDHVDSIREQLPLLKHRRAGTVLDPTRDRRMI